jgi:endonuclease/exonuclease/phosphatase family metal-dependent hydrolase
MKEEHGLESLTTFQWSGKGNGRYHIDYCFLSPALIRSASVRILDGPMWGAHSDHLLLQVDLPDET